MTIAKAISIFILAIREKSETYLNELENPSSGVFDPSIKIESFFKHNNYDVLKTGAFCNHDQQKKNIAFFKLDDIDEMFQVLYFYFNFHWYLEIYFNFLKCFEKM